MSAAPRSLPAPTAWSQLASGKALDFGRAVDPGLFDLRRDLAAPLGLITRYAGQLPSGIAFSVAQHCCVGAEWMMDKWRDPRPALAFLVHDAHEALIGDQTQPFQAALDEALAALAAERGVDLKGVTARAARKRVIEPLDAAIHALAGLDWPLEPRLAELVHLVDRRMLLTERRDLLERPPRVWDAALERLRPLDTPRLKPLSPARAAENWALRFEEWSARVRA